MAIRKDTKHRGSVSARVPSKSKMYVWNLLTTTVSPSAPSADL